MHFLIYLIPALMDAIVSQMVFVNAVRVAQMGSSDFLIANIWSVWGVPYMGTAIFLSRRLSERNAVRILPFSCAAMLVICTLFPLTRTFTTISVLTVFAAIAAALFFTSFQVFMKQTNSARSQSVAFSTGIYTFAWNMGYAAGPFLAGFLMETSAHGWMWTYAVSAGFALLAAAGVWRVRRRIRPEPCPPDHPAPPPHPDPGPLPLDFAWLAWIAGGVTLTALLFVRCLFPAMAEKELNLSESQQGLVFFLISIGQGLAGLSLCRSRHWMYRPAGIVLFALLGAGAVVLFIIGRTPPILYAAAFLSGIHSGALFFYIVFHCLVHPTRSARYIAVNESVIGFAGVAGPFFAGSIAQASRSYAVPFAIGIGMILAVTAFQAYIHARQPLPSRSATASDAA